LLEATQRSVAESEAMLEPKAPNGVRFAATIKIPLAAAMVAGDYKVSCGREKNRRGEPQTSTPRNTLAHVAIVMMSIRTLTFWLV
jgi:hypothetical protein